MALITTIQQVRDAGLKILFTNNMTTLADMKAAERRFLLPLMGKDLLATLQQQPIDQKFAELLAVAQRAEAHLAYWLDLPTIQVQISDNGLSSFENTNRQAAHRWEYLEVQEMLEQKGCEALEEMLELLHDNAAAYGWQMPAALKSFFITGKDFATYFNLYQPYRTFELLRPVVRQAEDQYIISTIGQELYQALLDNSQPGDLEKGAISLIKKALAHFTIKTAIEVLPVKISSSGFTVILSDSKDKPAGTEEQAPSSLLSLMLSSCERSGNSYLSQLKQLLDNKASETVFAEYFNSSLYSAPALPTAADADKYSSNRNSTRKTYSI